MIIFREVKTNLITQAFGENKLPVYKEMGMLGHNGIDWLLREGEPIYWGVDTEGLVLETMVDFSGGLGLIIRSKDGDKYYKHRFWHLKQFKVRAGETVTTGSLLGWGDSTGMSTGHHLHRDLKRCDKEGNTLNWSADYKGAIDYMPYFENTYVLDKMKILKLIKRITELWLKVINLKILKFKLFKE